MSTNHLDANNVIKKVYDPSTEALRTTSIATFAGDTVDVQISDQNDSIKIGDGEGDYLAINDDGSINTVVTGNLQVEISAADGDNIAISDGVDTLAVNPDGSINTVVTGNLEVEISAVDGDSIAVVGTESGAPSGIQHTLKIGADGNARVGDNFRLVPSEIDQITVTSQNANGDPLIIEYRRSMVLVATLTFTYDVAGNFQSVTRT